MVRRIVAAGAALAIVLRGGMGMVGRYLVLGVSLALLCASPVSAQTVALATLSGTVVDESGGALPGVEVNTLQVGDTRSANVTLKIGGLTEVIQVSADANLVQTQSLSVGQVTSQELIVGLPLNGRSATQLLLLEGGAVAGGLTTGNRGFPGQVAISVAGGTSNSTQYLVDGGYNNEPQSNAGNMIPFPDALQEFRTESGVRDARYGMSTGATVMP